jgi:hypothetical protein
MPSASTSTSLSNHQFENAGLLLSEMDQNRKVFRANKAHPLFPDIISILRKHVGVDINHANLERLALKAEKLVHRQIVCTILTPVEADEKLKGREDLWRIF